MLLILVYIVIPIIGIAMFINKDIKDNENK